jgi:hypothetical protein
MSVLSSPGHYTNVILAFVIHFDVALHWTVFTGSCHALTLEPFLFSIWLGQGVTWLGKSMFLFLFYGLLWFPIRVSCLLLSLIGDHT